MSNNQIREFTMDELGDPDAPVGSRLWSLWVANEIRKTVYSKQQADQRLQWLVETFKENQGFQSIGFLSWEDFCERKLQKPADEVEKALTPVQQAAIEARAFNPQGKHLSLDNCQVIKAEDTGGGNSADYLTARIARDAPETLERMKAGEYKSVRQAAIEAGIINPKVRYSLPSDPEQAGCYLAERVDQEWFLAMADAFYKNIGDRGT